MYTISGPSNGCCDCCGDQTSTAACNADAACKASVSPCCFASAGCDGCTTTCCGQEPTSVILKNDEHIEVDPVVLGGFGSSDFTIEFTFQGMGGDATPDGSYAALFVRSTQGDPPYSGPTAFVYDNGDVRFWMISSDQSCCDCCGDQTSTAACEADVACKASVSACCFASTGCDGCTTTCCEQECRGRMHGKMLAAPRRLRFENFGGRISFSTDHDGKFA